jgi:hypothetical protein
MIIHLFNMKNSQADLIDEFVMMPVIELPRIDNHFEMQNNSFSTVVDVNNDEHFFNDSVHSIHGSDLTMKFDDSEDHVSILDVSSKTQILTQNEFNIFNIVNSFSFQQQSPILKHISIFHRVKYPNSGHFLISGHVCQIPDT